MWRGRPPPAKTYRIDASYFSGNFLDSIRN
jgi:hypothetical protein